MVLHAAKIGARPIYLGGMIRLLMLKRTIFSLATMAFFASASAQVNAKGVLQFGLGASLGVHATHFTNEVSYAGSSKQEDHRDGAVTVTVPIEAQYGLADRFSIGLCFEPGSYLDSAGTHPNKLFLISLSPRYYMVNKDRFALYFNADLGLSYLRIGDVVNGTNRYNDRYGGEHFRIGATSQFFFGSVFGMNVGLKYAANNLRWRDRDPQDPILGLVDYSAKLKTSGVQLQLGLQVKI